MIPRADAAMRVHSERGDDDRDAGRTGAVPVGEHGEHDECGHDEHEVDQLGDQPVEPAAEEPGNDADDQRPEHRGEQGHEQSDEQRVAPADHRAHEQVTLDLVRPERMLPRRIRPPQTGPRVDVELGPQRSDEEGDGD